MHLTHIHVNSIHPELIYLFELQRMAIQFRQFCLCRRIYGYKYVTMYAKSNKKCN